MMTTEDALRVGLRTATMAVRVRERRTGNHVCVSPVNDRWQCTPRWSGPAVLKISEDISAPLPPCIAADAGSLSAPEKLRRRAKPCSPKHGRTGLDSGLKKPRLMVLLVLISTDFTHGENNVRSGYCWWRNARHECIQAYTQHQQESMPRRLQKRTQI